MNYLPEFLTVAAVHLVAVSSPGPDFFMISRNSLVHSRRTGIWSSFGIGVGNMTHVTYSLVGLGLVISRSVVLFSTLKFAGAAYLTYVGWKCLRAKPPAAEGGLAAPEKKPDLTRAEAFRLGLFTNLLNPKASLFFLALFSQVIDPGTPKSVQVLYGVETSIAAFAWFALVATTLAHSRVREKFAKAQHKLERAFGVILIAFGAKLALTSAR